MTDLEEMPEREQEHEAMARTGEERMAAFVERLRALGHYPWPTGAPDPTQAGDRVPMHVVLAALLEVTLPAPGAEVPTPGLAESLERSESVDAVRQATIRQQYDRIDAAMRAAALSLAPVLGQKLAAFMLVTNEAPSDFGDQPAAAIRERGEDVKQRALAVVDTMDADELALALKTVEAMAALCRMMVGSIGRSVLRRHPVTYSLLQFCADAIPDGVTAQMLSAAKASWSRERREAVLARLVQEALEGQDQEGQGPPPLPGRPTLLS